MPAFAGTAAAIDSSSTADSVPHSAVVEVSSRAEWVRLPVRILTAIDAYNFSKVPHLFSAPAVGLLEILVRAMDRLLLLPTQLSVRGLERRPIRFPILLRE